MAARCRVSPPVGCSGSHYCLTTFLPGWLGWTRGLVRWALQLRRAPHTTCALLLIGAMLLSACSLGQGSAKTATPTATLRPGPTPVATLLDPVPTTCPAAPALQTISVSVPLGLDSGSTTLHGSSPVWIVGFYYQTIVHVNSQGYTPWPGTKIVWAVGPDYPQVVTVQAINLRSGAPAWWGFGAPGSPPKLGTAGQTLILDPSGASGPGAADTHGSSAPGWNEWGSGLYLSEAGCYALEARWSGDQWRSIMAVGR
jgi:hypothetical protein